MNENPDLESREAAARERLEQAEARRASRNKPAKLAEIEQLERAAQEAEAIDAAEAEHGEIDKAIKVVRSPQGIVIVKRPPYVAMKAFHDKGRFTVEAKDKLGRPCVVYPDREAYARMAADDLALVVAVADAAAWLAGFGRTELQEKSEA